MSKYGDKIGVSICTIIVFIIILVVNGINFHYKKQFYNQVLQQATCENLNPYQITVYVSTIKDFPVDSLTYFTNANYNYKVNTNYTCWFNPFNSFMSLSEFTTLDDTNVESSSYYSSYPIYYSNDYSGWFNMMIVLFVIFSVLTLFQCWSIYSNAKQMRRDNYSTNI